MKRSIIKPILAGLIFGAAAFFAPFMLLKLLCFFFLVGIIMRLFGRRYFWEYGPGLHMVYADKIRGMNEEEYNVFKETIQKHHYGHCRHYRDQNSDEKEIK